MIVVCLGWKKKGDEKGKQDLVATTKAITINLNSTSNIRKTIFKMNLEARKGNGEVREQEKFDMVTKIWSTNGKLTLLAQEKPQNTSQKQELLADNNRNKNKTKNCTKRG